MATKISEQELANLAINLVKSPSAFQQMQQANQIQPDEFYLVEGDEAATYTFQDFTNGRFIVNQTKNGVVTPMTINTGSITGGSAITSDATVIGGIVPTGVQGYELSALKKTISGQNGVVVSASGTNSIIIGLDAVTGLTAGSVGPISAIQPAHGETVSIPYITYDTYGRITSAINRVLTLPVETQLSAAVPDGVTAYNVGQTNDFYVVGGLTTANHKITVAKKKLSAGAAMTIATASNEIVIAHSDTSTLAAGAHNAGDGAFIRSITTDEYGHITAVSTADESTAPTIAIDSNASDPNNPTLIAGLTAENHLIKVARKTITAGTGIAVNNTTSAITIGIQSFTVSTSTAATSLAHNGTVVLPSSITVNNLGQVTAIKTTTYTMPGETQLSVGNNAGATNCELINSITVNNHAITLTKSKIVAGTAIAVASKDNNGQYNIEISHGSTNAASTLTPAADTFINGLTLDSFGHVVGISTAVESTGASLSVSSNAGDNGMVITGMTLGGDHNHEITVVKRAISAGNAITVSTTTAGKIIVNHSDTSSAVTVASAAGKFVNAISVDTYGHITGMATTSETVLAASGTTGTENNKVITGLAFSGHQIYAAKKTLEGINGITVTNASDKLSIGITTLTVGVISGTKTLSHGGTVTVLSSVTTNSYGQTTAVKTVELTMPSETALSFSGSLSGADNGQVLTGFSVSGHQISSIARRTVEGSGAITVSTSTAGKIVIAHSDTSNQASITASGRKYITSVTLDAYGHVTGLSTGTETVVNVDDKTAVAPNTTANWYKLTAAPMSGATSSVSVSSTVAGILYNNNISMQMSTGTLRANIYRVQDKVELQYNSATDALDFVFI